MNDDLLIKIGADLSSFQASIKRMELAFSKFAKTTAQKEILSKRDAILELERLQIKHTKTSNMAQLNALLNRHRKELGAQRNHQRKMAQIANESVIAQTKSTHNDSSYGSSSTIAHAAKTTLL